MQKLNHVYFLVMVAVLLNTGCQSMEVENPIVGCPAEPDSPLRSENLEFVSLVNDELILLANTSSQEPRGYQFFGEAGQILEYETEQTLCIWIYSPDNQLLESNKLPMTGNYIVQISSSQPQEFQLALGLDVSSQMNNASAPNPFENVSFPQSTCGDPKPSTSGLSSVDFYPVNLPDSSDNLNIAQANFCRDAYRKRDKNTGQITIQISSFTDPSKAQQFADFISSQIAGAYVGSPTTIYLNN